MLTSLSPIVYILAAVVVFVVLYGGGVLGGKIGLGRKNMGGKGREINPTSNLSEAELGKHFLVMTPLQRQSKWDELLRRPKRAQVILGEAARFLHMQIIGASGTGKTYYGIYPFAFQDIRSGAGCVFFDPKSNMRDTLASYAVSAGRGFQFLSIDLTSPDESLTYSPLVGDDPHEIANRLHTALYQDDETSTGFYREAALAFFRNFFVICHELKVLPTLAQLMECAADQEKLQAFVSLSPKSKEAEFLTTRYLSLHSVKYGELFEGCVNKLSPLAHGPFAKIINTTSPDITMRDVVTSGKILHLGLAADRYPSDYKTISTMALMDLQSCLTHRYSGQHKPMFLYLDEFGDLVYPQFKTLVSKAREAKVGIIIAHQALGDLMAWGAPFTDSVFTSTSNKVIFRVGSPETAEQIARLVGTKTMQGAKINYSLADGNQVAKGLTETHGDEFLAHPNTLKNLGVGEALMIVQRRNGREPHHGMMIPAPQPKPLLPNQFSKPTVKAAFQTLDLSGKHLSLPAPVTTPVRVAKNLLTGNKKRAA